jgi:predicted tellurium resistance membrane protein TerC
MIELMSDPETWISLLVLSVMEIVLGIDNIVFITILCGRLPKEKQLGARRLGLFVALFARLALLSAISWVMRLEEPLLTIVRPFSGKDLILVGGGLFLLYKATHEIFVNVEHPGQNKDEVEHEADEAKAKAAGRAAYLGIIAQVMVLDIVFSIDSVITAIGLAEHLPVMVIAIVISVGVMLLSAKAIGDFVERHPTIKMLALSFLILIGVMLVAEGFHAHVPRGYIYFAMAFSLAVELLNLRLRKVSEPVRLHQSYVETPSGQPPDGYSALAAPRPRTGVPDQR